MVTNRFVISGTSDRFWNRDDFIKFLIKNQNSPIELTVDPEAICFHTLGVYELLDLFSFESVNILTRNPFEHHPNYHSTIIANQWLPKLEKIDPFLHNWNGKKIFYALFGRPTAARLGIAAHLLNNYSKQSHVHFSANTHDDNLIQFELDKLLEYDQSLIEPAGRLINVLPILLSDSSRYSATNGYDFDDPLTKFYKDILIDVVVESHVIGNTFFPTEKILRPIWLKKPFIVFSSKNFLEYLRQMGFRTFSDFWDEDYDGFEGRDRLRKILMLIDNLASMSKSKLEKMYWDMQYSLDHNFRLLATKSYSTVLTEII